MSTPVYVVIGAGPGLGLGVSRRFAREGYAAVLVGATAEAMEPLAQTLRDEGFEAYAAGVNLTDADSITATVREIGESRGRIDVLHFNPSAWREKSPLELTAAELLEDVMFGVGALLPAVQAARPYMSEGARVLVTGSAAADTPYASAASLGVQKAGVRNLISSLDTTLAPDGIRAVCLQINGELGREGPFSPPPIADAMWAAVSRGNTDWTAQVSYAG
jgi:NAD(P)-dependent dehydrogenase (short-subunit alcohol dehydrogenase family)